MILKSLGIFLAMEKGFIEQIREKLSSYFKVDEQITVQMDKSLCLAIREWATTMRQHEQITREDLFEALSIGQDNMMGEHSLPPCSPFFSSRISFVDDIEVKLKSRQYPVVFLEGIPGSGKTNIVSYLATKRFSCIDLRFHAFKPIYPGDKYLQNDQGLSDPCALWGDLLIQLRLLLKGRLAEFDVPISNQILQKYEKMREEVLRIANAYGKNQNRTFVIAIDGIDHAARAGLQNTFLSTLIPPEGVPENVCFLIAGQPLQYYDEYPVWLQNKDLVFHCEVPPIQSEDVIQLLQQNHVALSDCSYGRAAEVIIEKVAGNTLSSVFAVYECKNTSTLDQLVKRIECTSLSSGIQALDWFNVIDKESLDWQEIGMRFLNISEYASRVGDNRAAIRIQGAIASLIAQHGVATIDAFIKTIVPTTMPELQFVLDAIIESFSYLQISNEEILEIWKTVVELLNIDHTCPEYDSENAIRIAYIYDLRIAIKTYLSNHSENNPDEIINAMREYSPFEYEIESGPERITFTLPDRWFYSQYKNSKVLEFIEENANNAVDTIFAKLQGLIEKGDRARWDLAIGFLDLLQEKSVAVTNCVASIFDLSINHRRPDPWEYDGVNRLYERMWPYLDDAQKEVLVSSLHVHYQQCQQVEETGLPNFFYLCNDIHQMILWQAPLLDNSTKINALKIILDMHTNWITSLNKRVYTPRYSCVVEADENATWKDVCQLLKTISE